MRPILLALSSLAVLGCSANPTYRTADEFDRVVRSWLLTGTTLPAATAQLSEKGFTCTPHSREQDTVECLRHVGGLPCVQHQSIALRTNSDGKVSAVSVGT